MDSAVIRICYENFAVGTYDVTGLHGRAERGERGITLCLLPGLTTEQRRAVIRRLRQEASRGFGPPLPLPQLAIALCLDRVRTTARMAGAIVRLHPAVTLLPGAFMVAVMALFVIASAEGPGSTPRTRVDLAEAAHAGGSSLQVMNAQAAPAPTAGARTAAGTRVRAAWYTCPQATGPSRIVPTAVSLPADARRAGNRRIPPTCRVPGI
jgi:hypothetical protein